MVIILYIIFAVASAGWAYWDRLNDYVDHDFDGLYAIGIGVFFPVTIPFAVLFSCLRKMKEKRDKK